MRKVVILLSLFSTLTLSAQSIVDEICLADINPGDSYDYATNKLTKLGFKEKIPEETYEFFDEKSSKKAVKYFNSSLEYRKNNTIHIEYEGFPHGALGATIKIIEWTLYFDDDAEGNKTEQFYYQLQEELKKKYNILWPIIIRNTQTIYTTNDKKYIQITAMSDAVKMAFMDLNHEDLGNIKRILLEDLFSLYFEENSKVLTIDKICEVDNNALSVENERECNEILENSCVGDVDNDGNEDAIIIWGSNSPIDLGTYGYTIVLGTSDKDSELVDTSFTEILESGEYALPMKINKIEKGIVYTKEYTYANKELTGSNLEDYYYQTSGKYIFSKKDGKLIELRN